MKLYNYFKDNPLNSKIGEFELMEIGEKNGGNSNVLFFKHKESLKEFAVKFLTEWSRSDRKIKRFIDEYFALIQLPPHKNIVKQYHLDSFEYEEEGKEPISITYIVMKKYSSSLRDRAYDDYDGFKILKQIGSGLQHLHRFGVIHRDIKPENIFYDDDINEYVIGDFGIAHFDEEYVAKLSQTTKAERLANFSFSPEESTIKNYEVKPSFDIYSFGQVIHWWYTNQASKGNRTPFATDSEDKELFALDQIVHKCIFNNPDERFQNMDELFESYKNSLTPRRDIYQRTFDLNKAITKTIPSIQSISTIETQKKFDFFCVNLKEFLNIDEFWWVNIDGNDLDFKGLDKINGDSYLFSEYYEIEIEKIIFYKHDSKLYNNFFIILTKPSEKFAVYDKNSELMQREDYTYYKDIAVLFEDKYYDTSLFQNGFFEKADGEIIELKNVKYEERHRILVPYAFLVCPKKAGPSMSGNDIAAELLKKVRESGELAIEDINWYLKAIRKYHSSEFTMWD